jgi:hypothetical protein
MHAPVITDMSTDLGKKVGKRGEKAFADWCAQADLTAHPPDDDCFGWDYLVEFPGSIVGHRNGLADSAPAPIECRVQVKATNGTERSEPIKLSHMLRLSKLQMPVFFCFLQYDGKRSPVRAYVVHLGKDLIARTLERVRQLSASGVTDFHKHTVNVTYDDSHEIHTPFDLSLRSRMQMFLPDGMKTYIEWKNNLNDMLGFDHARITSKVTIKLSSKAELIDFFLGLKESVELTNVHTQEVRFGVPHNIDPTNCGTATLSIVDHHPRTDCNISVRRDPFSPAVDFSAALYVPPSALELADDEFKVRLVASTFELFLWPRTNRLTIQGILDAKGPYTLGDLKCLADAMVLLTEACTLEITLAGKSLIRAESVQLDELKGDWRQVQKTMTAAWELAERAGVANLVRADPEHLMRDTASILMLHGLINASSHAKVQFTDPSWYVPGKTSAFVKAVAAIVGDFRIAGVMAVVGQPCIEDGAFTLVSMDIRFFRLFGEPAHDEWGDEREAQLIKIAKDALAADGILAFGARV